MAFILQKFPGTNSRKNVGHIVPFSPQRFYPIRPFTVLHAAVVFAAGIFLRQLDGSVITKPANMLEWPPGRFFHGLHPAAHGFGIGRIRLGKRKAGNQ